MKKPFRLHTGFVSLIVAGLVSKIFFRPVAIGRLSTKLQTWSWSGTQRSVKRQHSGNEILKWPFIMTVTDKLAPHWNFKIQECICPSSHMFFFFVLCSSVVFSCFFHQSNACFDIWNYWIKSLKHKVRGKSNHWFTQASCYNIPVNLKDFISYFLYKNAPATAGPILGSLFPFSVLFCHFGS